MRNAIANTQHQNLRLAVQTICQALPHNTRLPYSRHAGNFLAWLDQEGRSLTPVSTRTYKAVLMEQQRSASVINQALAAIRFFVREAAKLGYIEADKAEKIASVEAVKTRGARLGTWLNKQLLETLLASPGEQSQANSLQARRDQAILAVLGGAGLRRSEVASLAVEQLRMVESRWVLADIAGKGGVVRSVPIAGWIKETIDAWLQLSGITSGKIFRACSWKSLAEKITTADSFPDLVLSGEALTPESIRLAVHRYSETVLGFAINPHDLRRSFARLARANGCPLEQIKLSLGHRRIETTETYTNMPIDFVNSPSDFLHLNVKGLAE